MSAGGVRVPTLVEFGQRFNAHDGFVGVVDVEVLDFVADALVKRGLGHGGQSGFLHAHMAQAAVCRYMTVVSVMTSVRLRRETGTV